MPRAALALICVAVLVGCTTNATDGAFVAANAYASEPFPVRLINRSKFDKRFVPTDVANTTGEPAGTIVIDTANNFLYWIETPQTARRYGIAVGAAGQDWHGVAAIERKAKWPAWYPTDDMHARSPGLPGRIEPGPQNPLGARALYLYANGKDTLYRIHGTSEPWTIGTKASSGCIRMLNEDVIDLFDKAPVGTKVIVM